ncbi:MAG: asparagine synthase-related protein [bacterium]|nr:asparagine synthase-related protein [bacterium]
MCGIAGFYGFRDDKLIKKFSKELAHRGPDGEGFFIDEKVTLLNRRLAIIDLKTGDQPIFNEDKSMVVVYNGEIYNYQELRSELEKKGHKFKTQADTEVIVHGYEEWGEDCFDRFNGMFGIALYDIKKKKLILVRDHFGIKPLYYTFLPFESLKKLSRVNSSDIMSESDRNSRNFLSSSSTKVHAIMFSSEIKPLIYSGLIEKKPNEKVLYRYLRYRIHDDSKETFFENIFKLMPGEMLVMQNSKFEIKKYSNIKQELIEKSLQDNKNELTDDHSTRLFRKELIQAITYRLIADVPVGTCLSGGLDSSTVVAIVNKLLQDHVKESKSLGKKQNTFSAVFPGLNNDEEKYVDELIKEKTKIDCHKVYPKSEEFLKDLHDFVKTMEEPIISTGPYAQYKVMEKAHEYVKVLLDGQGSDEMMAGYDPYFFVYLKELWITKKHVLFFKEIFSSWDILSKHIKNKIKQTAGFKKIVSTQLMLRKDFNDKYFNESYIITTNNLKKRLVEDIFYNSLPSLLRYEDKNTMRFSIEGRVPFLDFNLIRYIFSLPSDQIIRNGWNKFIMRQSTKDILPEMINQRRNKIGFTTPEFQWFMNLKSSIYSIFLSESFANRKYFNQHEVLKAFREFYEGKNDDTMLFWRIINVEYWLREFIDDKMVGNGLKPFRTLEKNNFQPNKGKKIEIEVDGKSYSRYPIRTEVFAKGDEYATKIANSLFKFLSQVNSSDARSESDRNLRKNLNNSFDINQKWFIVVSEKIVAISQGRSYFIWDIKPSFWAKILSNYVTRTPTGIGLGSPWTMQIAIQEAGLPRIFSATIFSVLGKLVGIKGVFYKIAGETVRSIDGPTEYSLYPSNVSAKLGPKDPQQAVKKIHDAIKSKFQSLDSKHLSSIIYHLSSFLGVVIIDANDIGRNILGNTTGLPNNLVAQIFKDNPMGQSNEQTPLIIVNKNVF